MTQLRLPPSGPRIVGTNVGDILIWNGTEWVPGPPSGAGAEFHARRIGLQAAPLGALALFPDSVLQFDNWTAGQSVFTQSVVQLGGTSSGEIAFQLWVSPDGVGWEPFAEYAPQGIGFSEGAVFTWSMRPLRTYSTGWRNLPPNSLRCWLPV